MSASKAGENWAGYTKSENVPGEDGKAVDARFSKLWPAGTPGIGAAKRPGGQQLAPRQLVHDGPKTPGGKRSAARKVTQPKPKRRKKA